MQPDAFEHVSRPAGRVIDAIVTRAIEAALEAGDKAKAERLRRMAKELTEEMNAA